MCFPLWYIIAKRTIEEPYSKLSRMRKTHVQAAGSSDLLIILTLSLSIIPQDQVEIITHIVT